MTESAPLALREADAIVRAKRSAESGPVRLGVTPEAIEAATARHAAALGVPASEPEYVYQAKRARLAQAVERGELTAANITPQLAWYLPTETLRRLLWDREPAPSARSFGVPLGADMLAAIDADRLGSTPVLERVRRWWDAWRDPANEHPKPVLVVMGTMGVGKTVAAGWLCREAGRRSRYVKSADLCSVHGSRWSEHAAAWADAVDAHLLVIDEVGGALDAARERAAIHDAIDGRLDDPTLVISNLSPDALRARLDARTIDRLREHAAFCTLDAPSLRGQA